MSRLESDGTKEWKNVMVNNEVRLALRKDGLPAGLGYYPVMLAT